MEACSLTAREKAKAAELTAAGHPVSAVTVKRHRQRYGQTACPAWSITG